MEELGKEKLNSCIIGIWTEHTNSESVLTFFSNGTFVWDGPVDYHTGTGRYIYNEVIETLFLSYDETGLTYEFVNVSFQENTMAFSIKNKILTDSFFFVKTSEENSPWKETISGKVNNYGYVDLGLSVKWASCNVGAFVPEKSGAYFAWGETETKDPYNWFTYKYALGSSKTMEKYCTNNNYGKIDNKIFLEFSDDVARIKWGINWRIPTDAEWSELREKCIWTWTAHNGVKGYKVKSKLNGNFIFIVAAGYCESASPSFIGSDGYYWSSSLIESCPSKAWAIYFSMDNIDKYDCYRYHGLSVRPVCP